MVSWKGWDIEREGPVDNVEEQEIDERSYNALLLDKVANQSYSHYLNVNARVVNEVSLVYTVVFCPVAIEKSNHIGGNRHSLEYFPTTDADLPNLNQ